MVCRLDSTLKLRRNRMHASQGTLNACGRHYCGAASDLRQAHQASDLIQAVYASAQGRSTTFLMFKS